MPAIPILVGGVSVHRPWQRHREYANVHNDLPHGYRYSYNERATPLMRFEIEYGPISDDDCDTLRAFWDARKGQYETFEFTDPETAITYTKCRFAMDSFSVRRLGPNENAVNVVIQEFA